MAERLAVAPTRPATTEGNDVAGARRAGRDRRSVVPITPKRTFRLPEVVLGVMLVAGCALGAVLWQRSTNTTETFVVAARSIDRGTVITAEDLRGAEMGGETSTLIAGSDARALVGQVAVVDIAEGAPMSVSLLVDEQPLAADEALTSMALEPGQAPPDLALNDRVRVVVTSASDGTGAVLTTMLDATAVVWSVGQSQDGISTVVTVRGPLSLATDVAAAVSVRLARVEG